MAVLPGAAARQTQSPQHSDSTRYFVPIEGRVIDYAGAAVRNQTLSLNITGREIIKVQTDQSGAFRVQVEGDQRISLEIAVAGLNSTVFDMVIKQAGDIGTIVLQPLRPQPLADVPHPTNAPLHSFLSGRLADADGVPMADKILVLTNRGGQPFILKMDRNGIFVFPHVNQNEFQIFLASSGAPSFLSDPGVKEIGRLVFSDGQDADLGNIVLRQMPSGTGPVGDLAGPVKITPLPSRPESKSPAATRTNPASIAAIFAGADGAAVIHGDGKVVRTPKEHEQRGVSSLKVSEDKTAGGWLVDSDFCCTSYPLSFALVVYRAGKPLRKFTGDGRAIFGWDFAARGRQVGFFQSYPHGDLRTHYELRDIDTQRLAGEWDEDSGGKKPEWASKI